MIKRTVIALHRTSKSMDRKMHTTYKLYYVRSTNNMQYINNTMKILRTTNVGLTRANYFNWDDMYKTTIYLYTKNASTAHISRGEIEEMSDTPIPTKNIKERNMYILFNFVRKSAYLRKYNIENANICTNKFKQLAHTTCT